MRRVSVLMGKPHRQLLKEMQKEGFNKSSVIRLGVVAIAKKHGFNVSKFGIDPNENNINELPDSKT